MAVVQVHKDKVYCKTIHRGVSVVFREAFGNLAQKNRCHGLCKHEVGEADLVHLWQFPGPRSVMKGLAVHLWLP